MHARPGKHPDEQTLEAYLMGSLPLRKARRIEEHVLECPECVDTAEEIQDYIRCIRTALGRRKTKLSIAVKARPG